MLNFIIHTFLTLATLAGAVYFYATGDIGWGIFMTLGLIILVLGYVRNLNIILALNDMRLQKQDKAIKRLEKVDPRFLLMKSQKAYYHYLKALTGSQKDKMNETEKLFRKALSIGLRTKQDQAVAKMNLAAICMGTGRKKEAQQLIREAEKLDENGMLEVYLKEMKKQSSMAATSNQMRMAQMRGGKGFRKM